VPAVYSCDTSTIIQAWRRDYSPKVFVGVWQKLEAMVADETLIASSEVLVELKRKDDEVYKWCKRQARMFVALDEEIQKEVKKLLAAHQRLIDTRNGRSGADPFVIALAKIRNAAVLTDEKSSNSVDRPKIPDVCKAVGIECCRLSEVFERAGLTFN
jgi:Domain of unknown function (DUF4411)